jgi:hypothetical protein
MEVKEAIQTAKRWVADVLQEENVSNIGLEEVESTNGLWRITIGFSRPWNTVKNPLTILSGEQAVRRTYRVIIIRDADGKVLSMTKRDKDE